MSQVGKVKEPRESDFGTSGDFYSGDDRLSSKGRRHVWRSKTWSQMTEDHGRQESYPRTRCDDGKTRVDCPRVVVGRPGPTVPLERLFVNNGFSGQRGRFTDTTVGSLTFRKKTSVQRSLW